MIAPIPPPEAIPERPGVFRFEPRPGAPGNARPTAAALFAGARQLGIPRLGVAPVEDFPAAEAALRRWLEHSYDGEMRYLRGGTRGSPRALLPEAQSLLAIALPHARPSARPRATGQGVIASYAQSDDYHHVIRRKLLELGQLCAELVGRSVIGRVCVDSAPLLEREAARRAGLGFTGKSTLHIVPGVGSYVLLGELLIDAELPLGPETQARVTSGCGRCTRCLDECPTRAFVGPYELDARRCISYLTIELKGSIPASLRALMGVHVFGCDICQEVCPFNASRKSPLPSAGLEPRAELDTVDLIGLLELSSSRYRKLVRGTALRRVSRPQLQRNAAVALGNSGDVRAIEPLRRALRTNSSALVRGHVAWALGQFDSDPARRALHEALAAEVDHEVRHELQSAIKEPRQTRML